MPQVDGDKEVKCNRCTEHFRIEDAEYCGGPKNAHGYFFRCPECGYLNTLLLEDE